MFLDLKNIDIGYNTALLRNANAQLELGEVCLLIGNNGVGKTTLLKTILGQIPTLRGNIFIQNRELKNLQTKQIAEQISVVFANPQIANHYTVRDLISLGKYIHYPYYFKLNDIDQQEVSDIIKSLGLMHYENFLLKNLSDGNLQKAFIGRALAQNSPLMILDEPTTHLDEENKLMILQLLRKLAKQHQKVILFSSHDWRLSKEFADKIWYLKNQELYAGVAEDVLFQHQELSKPQLFTFETGFVLPKIVAPDYEKELLYSFLQKNIAKDLSVITFTWENSQWSVSIRDETHIASRFADILKLPIL